MPAFSFPWIFDCLKKFIQTLYCRNVLADNRSCAPIVAFAFIPPNVSVKNFVSCCVRGYSPCAPFCGRYRYRSSTPVKLLARWRPIFISAPRRFVRLAGARNREGSSGRSTTNSGPGRGSPAGGQPETAHHRPATLPNRITTINAVARPMSLLGSSRKLADISPVPRRIERQQSSPRCSHPCWKVVPRRGSSTWSGTS